MHRNCDYPPHRVSPSKRIVHLVSSPEPRACRHGSLRSRVLVAQASRTAEKMSYSYSVILSEAKNLSSSFSLMLKSKRDSSIRSE
jgi:hypothetical protein